MESAVQQQSWEPGVDETALPVDAKAEILAPLPEARQIPTPIAELFSSNPS